MKNNLSVVRRLDGCGPHHTDSIKPLTAAETAALERYWVDNRWALGGSPLSLEMLRADRKGLDQRMRLGWILSTPEALALVPHHDRLAIARLDPGGRPFLPDVPRVTLAPKVAALQALGLPRLLERFAGGEVIAATDPALLALHAKAYGMECKLWLIDEGLNPTLRNLLWLIGWRLQKSVKRGRDVTYAAAPIPLPEGASWNALTAKWLKDLRGGCVEFRGIEWLEQVWEDGLELKDIGEIDLYDEDEDEDDEDDEHP